MDRTAFTVGEASSGASDDALDEPAPAAARPGRVGMIRNIRSHRNKGADPDYRDDPGFILATPQTKPELAVALAQFARERIGLLVIDGGDGTVRDVLTRALPVFKEGWPPVIVLPRGKTNALAYNLGLPRNWPLEDALRSARKGRTVSRRPLVIERLDALQRDRVGFLMGAGVINAAIEAGQTAHRAGAFESLAVGVTSAMGVLQTILGFGADSPWRRVSPMRVRLGDDLAEMPHSGHGQPGGRFLFGVSTLARFPFGLKPFPKVIRDSHLNYLVYDAPLRRAVALFLPMMFGMDPASLQRLGIHRGTTSQIHLELGESFILDGETYPGGTYRVSLGPELDFVVP
jgi:diacylglycerol kinase (ATP)